MVRHKHRYAQPVRLLDAREARNAIVDRDQQPGGIVGGHTHDFRTQPVAELEAIRHEIVDVREPEFAQAAQHQCGAGCAVHVKIPDHSYAGLAFRDQQVDGGIDVLQQADRGKTRQRVVQLRGIRDSARSEQPRVNRVQLRQGGKHLGIGRRASDDGSACAHAAGPCSDG